MTQHLIRVLEHDGESAAAALVARLGNEYVEDSRELAYRLYQICNVKGWAQEGASLNGLVIAWPELVRLARRAQAAGASSRLFGK